MSGARPWTLQARITSWVAVATTVVSLAILGLSFLYVRQALQREVAALASEEIQELRVKLSVLEDPGYEEFDAIAAVLDEEHPINPFAWHVWSTEDGTLLHSVGRPDLVAVSVPLRQPMDRTRRLGNRIFWTTSELDPKRRFGIVIDASAQAQVLRRYAASGLVGLSAASLLAALGGWLFARRVGRQLNAIVEQVRDVKGTSQELELSMPHAPAEILEVAGALNVMLENIREESEKARLITAGLAHELRSPIQTMQGEVEVGLLRDRSGDEYRAILESQLDELRDFGRVVDNLVSFTSAPQEEGLRGAERFDLQEEARLRLSREVSLAARKGVELEIESDPELLVVGDREALILAIRNLVANAIQWSPEGGVVRLTLTRASEGIVVQVDDQGPGVPHEDRRRIFEPFVTRRAVSGRRMGYGLGLALASRAVESHGGSIEVGDSPSGGARFTLRLVPEAGAGASAAVGVQ